MPASCDLERWLSLAGCARAAPCERAGPSRHKPMAEEMAHTRARPESFGSLNILCACARTACRMWRFERLSGQTLRARPERLGNRTLEQIPSDLARIATTVEMGAARSDGPARTGAAPYGPAPFFDRPCPSETPMIWCLVGRDTPMPAGADASQHIGQPARLVSAPRTWRCPCRRRCTGWPGPSWRRASASHATARPGCARRRRRWGDPGRWRRR